MNTRKELFLKSTYSLSGVKVIYFEGVGQLGLCSCCCIYDDMNA